MFYHYLEAANCINGNYTDTIDADGVRFRTSPKISSSNIIRTFTKGEKIGVYQSDIQGKSSKRHMIDTCVRLGEQYIVVINMQIA